MPREKSKTKAWEKCRRDRMKEAFTNLEKVLPNYEPANTMSKIDILQHSKDLIEELQLKVQKLMNPELKENQNVIDSETRKLKERIKKLLSRNEILCKMLKDAKVGIPKFKNPRLWVGKISKDQAKIMQQKNEEIMKSTKDSKNKSTTLLKNSKKKKARLKKNRNKIDNKILYVVSQPVPNMPCYLIQNNLSKPQAVSNNETPKLVSNISSLGKGTLIFPNGNVLTIGQNVPVSSTPSLVTNIHNFTKQILKYSTSSTVSTNLSNVPHKPITILSKPSVCYTRTTQINKVPIPSLSSSYKRYLTSLEKNKPESVATKKTSKIKNTKQKPKEKDAAKNKNETPEDNVKTTKNSTQIQETNSNLTELKKENKNDELKNKADVKNNIQTSFSDTNDINYTNISDKNDNSQNDINPPETNLLNENINNTENTNTLVNNEDIPPSNEENSSKLDKNITESLNAYENSQIKTLENLAHSELTNDLFSSLQPGSHNPESASPTAAFLLAFPLVSSLNGVKVMEGIDEENVESPRETPTLLQLGTEEQNKYSNPSFGESITPNLINMDTLSFFSGKEGFYGSFEQQLPPVDSVFNKDMKVGEINKNGLLVNGDHSRKNNDDKTNLCSNVSGNLGQYIGKFGKVDSMEEHSVNKLKDYKVNGNENNMEKNARTHNMVRTESTFQYSSKNYTEPLYTSCNNFNYNPNSFQANPSNENVKISTENYYKLPQKSDKTYNNMDNFTKDFLPISTNISTQKTKVTQISKITQDIPTYNWMTTPTTKNTDNSYIFPYSKDEYIYSTPSFITQTSYLNNTTDLLDVTKKSLDLQLTNTCLERSDNVEPNFSWSGSNKFPQFFDSGQNFNSSQNFPPTTLPTLVGDLALGNNTKSENKEAKNSRNRYQVYENQHNFFSVSHLVDHTKSDQNLINNSHSTRTRSKNSHKAKRQKISNESKEPNYKNCSNATNNKNNFVYPLETTKKNLTKNTSSCYSAEALISNSNSGKKEFNSISNNKNISMTPFIPDNIVPPYFPNVDFQTNMEQQNQNYQCFPHNFRNNYQKSNYNNTYSSNLIAPNHTLTSDNTVNYENNSETYIPFSHSNKEVNNSMHHKNMKTKSFAKDEKNQDYLKKSKKKNSGYADFSFLSVPGSSHYLPDDFHSHNSFLAPPPPSHSHIYSCKNPLYPVSKQNELSTCNNLLPLPPVPVGKNNAQPLPDINLHSGNNGIGSSLTNFNLSTIFPEINKAHILDTYADGKSKDQEIMPTLTSNSVNFSNNQPSNFSYSSSVQSTIFHNR